MTAMEAERNTMTGHRGDTVPANQGDTTMAKQSDTIEAKQGDTKRKQLWRQYNVTRARDHAADEASAAAAGVGLSALRKQAVFHFDVQRHPLLPVMLRCLGFNATGSIEEDQTLLEGLQPPASSAERTGCSGAHHVRKFRGGDRGPSTHWIQRWLSESPEDRKAHAEFNEEYLRLLRDVVLPQLADPRGLLFQRRPTFRCHVAGGGEATGVAHRDVDNGHPSAEINYWLPLTRVGGSNSLYSESAPGRADYAPFESEYGQVTRFWGAQCMHYTLPNETDRTRVSFDVSAIRTRKPPPFPLSDWLTPIAALCQFRVVPRSCYVEGECAGGRGDPYRPGEFYGEMDALGNVTGERSSGYSF